MTNKRNVIIHGESPLKGRERQGHKYVSRVWKNGKWRYFYKDTQITTSHELSGQIDTSRAGQEYKAPAVKKNDPNWFNNANKKKKQKKRQERRRRIRRAFERGKRVVEKLLGLNSTNITVTHDVKYGK